MRSVRWLSRFLAALVVVGGVLATGCTDRVTVFKQKPFFEQPPAGAGDFLGYSDQAIQDDGVRRLPRRRAGVLDQDQARQRVGGPRGVGARQRHLPAVP